MQLFLTLAVVFLPHLQKRKIVKRNIAIKQFLSKFSMSSAVEFNEMYNLENINNFSDQNVVSTITFCTNYRCYFLFYLNEAHSTV